MPQQSIPFAPLRSACVRVRLPLLRLWTDTSLHFTVGAQIATARSNSPSGPSAGSQRFLTGGVFVSSVCMQASYCIARARPLVLDAPLHVAMRAHVSSPSSALAGVCSSVIPPRPICLLSARLLCLLSFTPLRTPPLPTPPPPLHFSSLCLHLPHRLCISLHKARITQATPFHLLSSSSCSSLLPPSLFKIQSPVFSPSVCATRVCILFITILCPPLTALLLFLMHVEECAGSSGAAGIRFVLVLIFSFTCQSGSREISPSFHPPICASFANCVPNCGGLDPLLVSEKNVGSVFFTDLIAFSLCRFHVECPTSISFF